MHPSLSHTNHRPWPMPDRRWVMRQSWCDLLFAHWPVPVDVLRPLVPDGLSVETFDGTSWVGVVPFRMVDVAPRGCPAAPWLSAFPELNLRLYVERGGKPGVWFLSLDAGNAIAVKIARWRFHLPYFHARMTCKAVGDGIAYRSQRRDPPRGLLFEADYRPTGDVYAASPGTLEHWLTERYCLYAQSPDGTLFRGEIHHEPWPLQPASWDVRANRLCEPHGFALEGPPTTLHFARRIDVVVWGIEAVG